MEQVLVQNTDSRSDLHLLSISGSTVHFHCSFFHEKVSTCIFSEPGRMSGELMS